MTEQDSPESSDEPPPPERRAMSYSWLIPILTVVIVVAAVILGLVLQAQHFDDDPEPPDELPPAEELYSRHCAMCHGEDGQGEGARFPPLVDTDWVLEDKERLILINLHGMRGPIEVRGQTYNDAMPGFARQLSNEEIAAILTYIRTSWGHDATEVSAEDVADVRRDYPSPHPSWTVEEFEERDQD